MTTPPTKPYVPQTQGLGTVAKAILITCGVLAALLLLGGLLLSFVIGSAMQGIQNLPPGAFGTFATPDSTSTAPAGSEDPGTTAARFAAQGDVVCDANVRLSTALLEQGALIHAGSGPSGMAARGAQVLAVALEVEDSADLLGTRAPAGEAARIADLRNSASMLAGLTQAAVLQSARDDQVLALSLTYEAWDASAVLDRDLRQTMVDLDIHPGSSSTTDACDNPVDMGAWARMIEQEPPA